MYNHRLVYNRLVYCLTVISLLLSTFACQVDSPYSSLTESSKVDVENVFIYDFTQDEETPLDANMEDTLILDRGIPIDAIVSDFEIQDGSMPVLDQEVQSDLNPPDTAPPIDNVDCSHIAANPSWELCESTSRTCAGVFTDGAGCSAFCAASGLVCVNRFGGEPGCNQEVDQSIPCDAENGHLSDWCECGIGPNGLLPIEETLSPEIECETMPNQIPYFMEQNDRQAAFTQPHNWVLNCYPNAYTAGGSEHQECDENYMPDGSRTGLATYTFESVPSGLYEVYVGGRHTANRNGAGTLFIVDGHSKRISQRNEGGEYVWDYHGTYCLTGTMTVILDSTVNSGSDSTFGARLVPVVDK